MRLKDNTSPVVLSIISDPEATQDVIFEFPMGPLEVLNIVEGDELGMGYCKMALHVREPRVNPSVVGDNSIHSNVPFLLDFLF
jgi:hypothetical protein